MSGAEEPHALVIGVGNTERGDDAVGVLVARRLRARAPAGVALREHSGEPAALLDALHGAPTLSTVIIIDAAAPLGEPGAVHRIDAAAQPLSDELFGYSTHGFGVSTAVELARALEQLPPRLLVYAIEGRSWEPGAGLSAAVERAAREVEERVLAELAKNGRPGQADRSTLEQRR